MALMWLEKKQDGELSVKYDQFTGSVIFFWQGEEIAKRTFEECERIFPQYLWWKLKEKENEYIKFIL